MSNNLFKQEKILPVKMLQDFDLNVALDEVEYGYICSREVKKEIILQSSLTSSSKKIDYSALTY